LAAFGVIGTVIGFLAGRAYQAVCRAWSDYKKTKALVPAMWKAFWVALRAAILVVTVALVWAAGSVWVTVSGVPHGGPAPPPTSPSPSPSR